MCISSAARRLEKVESGASGPIPSTATVVRLVGVPCSSRDVLERSSNARPTRRLKRTTTLGYFLMMNWNTEVESLTSSVSRIATTLAGRGASHSTSMAPSDAPLPYSPTTFSPALKRDENKPYVAEVADGSSAIHGATTGLGNNKREREREREKQVHRHTLLYGT